MSIPTEEQILTAVRSLKHTADENKDKFSSLADFDDTGIDPMSMFVHFVFSGIKNESDFIEFEKARRIDKALGNKIGTFHEEILSSVRGWVKPQGGFDLKCEGKKIIVEIKNKYNTMNASATNDVYENCVRYYRTHRDWNVYLAFIIPKNGRINEPWAPAGKSPIEQIKRIDGATLYDMVMEEKDSLKKIYEMLPSIIGKIDLSMNKAQSSMLLHAYYKLYSEAITE